MNGQKMDDRHILGKNGLDCHSRLNFKVRI